jgi:hypothetical protein
MNPIKIIMKNKYLRLIMKTNNMLNMKFKWKIFISNKNRYNYNK